MIRRAFTMRLKANALKEYKRYHDHVWPELVREIERSGIASITTFQRDQDLFLFSQIKDEGAWDRLWNSDIHRRWADAMWPLMNLREDGIVDAGQLTEIFHLEAVATGSKRKRPRAAAKKSGVRKAAKTAGARKGTKKSAKGRAGKKAAKARR